MNGNTSAPDRQHGKPPAPVRVRASFGRGATRRDVLDGCAILTVRDGGGEATYWCQAVTDGGRLVAYRLRKFGTERQYDLPADLSSCDCGDRTHRPERPGGCRHMVALRQALAGLGAATA